MGRPPEVFVRPVTTTEGRRLQRIGRTAKDPVKLRRANNDGGSSRSAVFRTLTAIGDAH